MLILGAKQRVHTLWEGVELARMQPQQQPLAAVSYSAFVVFVLELHHFNDFVWYPISFHDCPNFDNTGIILLPW